MAEIEFETNVQVDSLVDKGLTRGATHTHQ